MLGVEMASTGEKDAFTFFKSGFVSVNAIGQVHLILTFVNTITPFRSVDGIFLFLVQFNRRDGVVVGMFASQSVDLGFIPFVESYQKTLKMVFTAFPA